MQRFGRVCVWGGDCGRLTSCRLTHLLAPTTRCQTSRCSCEACVVTCEGVEKCAFTMLSTLHRSGHNGNMRHMSCSFGGITGFHASLRKGWHTYTHPVLLIPPPHSRVDTLVAA